MEPLIHYTKTQDGVRIAYTTVGSGPPLVITPAPAFANILGDWEIPEFRSWVSSLAERYTVVLYDGRECGSSQRDVKDLSLRAHVWDLQAVIERLGPQQVNIFGFYHTSLAAIAYAAQDPERVQRMVLWHAYARAADQRASPQVAAVRSLMETSWEVFTETLARTSFGWDNGQAASRWAKMSRQVTTPDAVARWVESQAEFDVSEYLPRIKCPTLLLYRKDARRYSADLGISLASQIAGAQVQLLPGEAMLYFVGEGQAVLRVIDEFFSDEESGRFAPSQPGSGNIVTILFTDIENHTSLIRRLGDGGAREVVRAYETAVRESLHRNGGTEVKSLGDGFMASFGSAFRALECAIDLQRTFQARNANAQEPVHVRIGVNAGEPIAEDDDLFGSAVILAARTAAKAGGGEIVVTDVVRQLAAGKGFLFSDLGETELRGFEDPVRLFELRWIRVS